MADDQGVRAAGATVHRFGQPRFLGTGYQVVDEHAQPPLWAGPELCDDTDEIVDAPKVFDHHRLDPQIVAPHLLDELGVVAAFHVDPPGPGDPGACSDHRHRAPRGPVGNLGCPGDAAR